MKNTFGGVRTCQNLHFDKFATSVSIKCIHLDLFGDLVTWLFDLWPWKSIGFCTNTRCICVSNLVKICQCVRELCVIFHPDRQTNRQMNILDKMRILASNNARLPWVLLQVRACPLFSAKPLLNQCLLSIGGGVLGQFSDRDAPHRPSTRNATRVKKRGVETIHFAQFWWKIRVEIRHFPHFC